jgi:hypothetical protein
LSSTILPLPNEEINTLPESDQVKGYISKHTNSTTISCAGLYVQSNTDICKTDICKRRIYAKDFKAPNFGYRDTIHLQHGYMPKMYANTDICKRIQSHKVPFIL